MATATEPPAVNPPAAKYSPRTDAAEFTKGLPSLGVEPTPPPVPTPPEPPKPPTQAAPTPPPEPPKPAAVAAPPAPEPRKQPRTSKEWDSYLLAEDARLKERDAKISELSSRVSEFEKAPKPAAIADDDPRIVEAKKREDELSERLRLVDITQHPKFKAFYDGKKNAQIEMAKKIVGAESSEQIATLLSLPDNAYRQEKIEELVGQLSPIQQSRIGSVLNSLNEIEIEREGQIEQAKKDYTAYQEKAKKDGETRQAELKSNVEKGFTTVLSTLQNSKDKDGLFIFQKQDGNEDWNKGVDERVAYAKNLIFGQNDPQALMRAAFHAAALPGVVKSYQTLLSQVQGLQEQVKGLTAAQPNLQSHTTPEGGEKAPAGSPQKKGRGNFLGGREQAGDWIKSLNETGTPSE